MKPMRICCCALGAAIVLAVYSAPVCATMYVNWDVDPAQSFFRLNIADQGVTFGSTNATLRLRDNNSTTQWTDNGGKRTFLDGTVATYYSDGSDIQFAGGAHNLFGLEQANIRPDPNAFDPDLVNEDNPTGQYVGTATALAALGARVRATVIIITVDLGYLAINDTLFDLNSAVIPLGGGTAIAAASTDFTLSSANLNVDGLFVGLINDQPIPDTLNAPLALPLQLNNGAGSVTSLGGLNRKLTLSINIPFNLDFSGTIINGTATGQIVATALVPEPSSMILGATGMVGCVGLVLRRRARRR